MDTNRSRFLRDSNDVFFNILTSSHHHVCDFVRNDHNEWKRLWNGCYFFFGGRPDFVQNVLACHVVVRSYVTYADFGQQLVSFVHFFNRPCEHGFGFPHVGDNRVHQVRQRSVSAQLDHLRVDHQHSHFVGAASHQDRTDDRVQTNRLTRTSSTSDQQVRQRGQIRDHRSAHGVSSQEQRDLHLGNLFLRLLDHLTQANDLTSLIGNFDTYAIFAWNRRNDTHAWHSHRNR